MSNAVMAKKAIKEFKEAFNTGINNIVKASEIYVRAIDEDPSVVAQFKDEFRDSIPSSAWTGIEAVGRKWMHPQLIMGGMSNRKKAAIVRKLPYSTQERVFSHKRFPLLVDGGATLEVDVLEATAEQIQQLFDDETVRSIPAQRAWIEDKKLEVSMMKKVREEVANFPYTIHGGKVSFHSDVTMTRSDLKRLLLEM